MTMHARFSEVMPEQEKNSDPVLDIWTVNLSVKYEDEEHYYGNRVTVRATGIDMVISLATVLRDAINKAEVQ